MTLRIRYILVSAIALILLAGCASTDANKKISAFSDAANITIKNTEDAFNSVEQNYYQIQVYKTVANYDAEGFHPDSITPFLNKKELESRLLVLKALQQYSEKLALIMGDSRLKEFDGQTKTFGNTLKNLNDDFVKNNILNKGTVGDDDVKIFTTAINAFGHWFIEYKRQTAAKEIITEMDPRVSAVCDLLIMDIGRSRKGIGLRNQSWDGYSALMMLQDNYLQHNKDKLDPISKRNEIKDLANLVIKREEADDTLSATRDAILKLKETHSKLKDAFSNNTVEIDNLISQLISEGRRIKDYYDKLDSK